MLEICEVANKYKVPIISDEVYYGLVYDDETEFVSFGNVTKEIPVIVIY
jgi:aspartate/methionine/tyrosine aminotransferase